MLTTVPATKVGASFSPCQSSSRKCHVTPISKPSLGFCVLCANSEFRTGGIMSVFLMGVHDPKTNTWRTVTKAGNGHDDNALEEINNTLKVVKISKVR